MTSPKSKEQVVPEDIFQTACGIVMEAKSLKSMLRHKDVVDAIAVALEAERKRNRWLPRWVSIDRADKTITDVQDFSEVGITIRTSDRYWVRDKDGRVYEAAWSEGRYGRDYWWDFEGESPVDPVEFMPHPLDPRFALPTPPKGGEE